MSMSRGGAEREGDREFQARSTPSVEPNMGLDLTNLRSRPKWKPTVGCPTNGATQAALHCVLQMSDYILQNLQEKHKKNF